MSNSQSSPNYDPAIICGLAVIMVSSTLLLTLTWAVAATGGVI